MRLRAAITALILGLLVGWAVHDRNTGGAVVLIALGVGFIGRPDRAWFRWQLVPQVLAAGAMALLRILHGPL